MNRIRNRAQYKELRAELLALDHRIIQSVAGKEDLLSTNDREMYDRYRRLVDEYELKFRRPKK